MKKTIKNFLLLSLLILTHDVYPLKWIGEEEFFAYFVEGDRLYAVEDGKFVVQSIPIGFGEALFLGGTKNYSFFWAKKRFELLEVAEFVYKNLFDLFDDVKKYKQKLQKLQILLDEFSLLYFNKNNLSFTEIINPEFRIINSPNDGKETFWLYFKDSQESFQDCIFLELPLRLKASAKNLNHSISSLVD